ncbi:RNA methyltransferase, TrmA family protein [Plesiocystis pacifica SIR-1]|uniref:RNA methyltransferase, TrmA family protein n=1 Tax=Plesiocystis pacifica SIR-1 TaxID=391625 RepID=A6GEE5_9BACT|nr:23S rRNA (uracil(1939)-C(5))-methyltransferase RlmD [Plesiocystis pacifica]EDM75786.1 RNA methyltransferase, TrmA family protein [Plesiocystis pacifica SIR-1]
MGRRGRRRKRSWEPETAVIETLDRKGRGVVPAGEDGRPRQAFVHATLPGERVHFQRRDREGPSDVAGVLEVLESSPLRVEPRCAHYGVCGGCSLMHLDPDEQVALKQRWLASDFEGHGLAPERWLEPLRAEPWAYRRRARLGAKWVAGKDKVVVGFREQDKRFIANLEGCEVLAGRHGGALIPKLSELIAGLSLATKIPQVEVSVADDTDGAVTALVFRVLEPPTDEDRERLRAFAAAEGLRVFLQSKGLDTVALFADERGQTEGEGFEDARELSYALPEFELDLRFRPTDFVQVNAAINRSMIARAVELLALEPEHRVLDLFCGLGNFSLALARRAGAVFGVEGDAGLVARAAANAERNGLSNARFEVRDLYTQVGELEWLGGQPVDRVLLDPPRSGALAIVEHIDRIAWAGKPRLVYVACSPETLARDAAVLVGTHGYRLSAAGVMDMFPHTAHVESIALFERD